MGAGIVKRSISIAGHRTSVSLEEPFWEVLRNVAEGRALSVQALVGEIDAARGDQNLSSAIRVFVLNHVRGTNRPDSSERGAEELAQPAASKAAS